MATSAFCSMDDFKGEISTRRSINEQGTAIPARSLPNSLPPDLSTSSSLQRRMTATLTGFANADTHALPASLKNGPAWDRTKEGSIWDEVLRSQEHMKKNPLEGEVVKPTAPAEMNPAEAAVQTTIGSPTNKLSPPPMSNKKDGFTQFESGGADLHKRSWPSEKNAGPKWDKTPAGSIWDEIIKSQEYMKK